MRTLVRLLILTIAAGFVPSVYGGTTSFIFGYSPFGDQKLHLGFVGGGSTELDATATGWYDSLGQHTHDNYNYFAGTCDAADCDEDMVFHDFFVFNLATVALPVETAWLSLGNPSEILTGANGYQSPFASATFNMWDVSTAILALTSESGPGPDGQAIFNDLGTGVLFASRSVSGADNGTQVIVNLNGAGVAALNAAAGGEFAIGGSLVPEPASGCLVVGAMAALALQRRRRRA